MNFPKHALIPCVTFPNLVHLGDAADWAKQLGGGLEFTKLGRVEAKRRSLYLSLDLLFDSGKVDRKNFIITGHDVVTYDNKSN